MNLRISAGKGMEAVYMANETRDRFIKDTCGYREQYCQIGQKVIYEEKDSQVIKKTISCYKNRRKSCLRCAP